MSENRMEASLDLTEQAQHDHRILSSGSVRFHLPILQFLLALSESVITFVVSVDDAIPQGMAHQYDGV